MSTIKQKAGVMWLFRMAWRDGRASLKRLALFMSAIVLGIAALVSIQNFGKTLEETISGQSRELMGADFLIDSDHPATPRVVEIIDSLGGEQSKEVSFVSMALFPGKQGSKLIRVRAMEGAYPFYGALSTQPAKAAEVYQQEISALVDATLMVQFGLRAGDSIKIGNTVFPIGGSLIEAPGNTVVSTSVAPAVWIPYSALEQTGLVQTGSRLTLRRPQTPALKYGLRQ